MIKAIFVFLPERMDLELFLPRYEQRQNKFQVRLRPLEVENRTNRKVSILELVRRNGRRRLASLIQEEFKIFVKNRNFRHKLKVWTKIIIFGKN